MPMPFRCRSVLLLLQAAQRIALLLALTLTAACGSLAGPTDGAATSTLSPDYRTKVAKHLKVVFKGTIEGGVQISDPRWTQSNKGVGWMVCVRFQDRGHQRTYVFVFNGDDFIDERYAVVTDNCGTEGYSALDLGPGIRPGAFGDPGPLY